MLQAKDIRPMRSIPHRALMSTNPVFRNGMAFVRLPSGPAKVPIIFGFVRIGRRWRCEEMGRSDYPSYQGLFSIEKE